MMIGRWNDAGAYCNTTADVAMIIRLINYLSQKHARREAATTQPAAAVSGWFLLTGR
jgi:hypothetical protein